MSSEDDDTIALQHAGIAPAELEAQIALCRGDRRRALRQLLEAVVCDERKSLAVRRDAAAYLITFDDGAFSRRLWQQTVHMFELAELEARGYVSASISGGTPVCRSCQRVTGARLEVRDAGWHALMPPQECTNLGVGRPCALTVVGRSKVHGPATIGALDAQYRRPRG